MSSICRASLKALPSSVLSNVPAAFRLSKQRLATRSSPALQAWPYRTQMSSRCFGCVSSGSVFAHRTREAPALRVGKYFQVRLVDPRNRIALHLCLGRETCAGFSPVDRARCNLELKLFVSWYTERKLRVGAYPVVTLKGDITNVQWWASALPLHHNSNAINAMQTTFTVSSVLRPLCIFHTNASKHCLKQTEVGS